MNGAIRVYGVLVSGKSPDHPLVQLFERWRREADLRDRMSLAVSSGFTMAFEGGEDADLAAQALALLERAATRVGGVLGVSPLAPIPVVLYTGEQFRDITRAPRWAGGAFDGTIRIPMRGALSDPAIANLLRDVGSGENFESAFNRRMPRSLDDFEAGYW